MTTLAGVVGLILADERKHLRAWLEGCGEPVVAIRAQGRLPDPGDAAVDETLAGLTGQQHPDGSWGDQRSEHARIVSTLMCVASIVEVGYDDRVPAVRRALDFLARRASVGGCSIDGRRDGVLVCYTGILASVLIDAGRPEVARPLLAWLADYERVAYGDRVYYEAPKQWGSYLRTRYGGCLARTSCLIGVFRAGQALAAATKAGLDVPQDLHRAVCTLLDDRHLCFNRADALIGLGGRTKADPDGTSWARTAFPRSYLMDLVDVIRLAVDLGVPSRAQAPARALLGSWRLPTGEWPLDGRRHLKYAYRPSPVRRNEPSPWATLRVLEILP